MVFVFVWMDCVKLKKLLGTRPGARLDGVKRSEFA